MIDRPVPVSSRAREMPVDESTLARRAVEGCRDSFGALASLYTARVFALLRQRGMQPADAEDATQEAFVQAWRGLRTFDPTRPFAPWIFQIAVRCASHAHRRRRREITADSDACDHGAAANPAIDDREHAETVWDLAQRVLSPDQNTLLWLVYVEGLSGPDAARATGKTPVGVRVALHRARKRLERTLDRRTIDKAEP